MEFELVQYDDQAASARVRDLVGRGLAFRIRVTGEAMRQFGPHLAEGVLVNPGRLSTNKDLRVLFGYITIAVGLGRSIAYVVSQDHIDVCVSSTTSN